VGSSEVNFWARSFPLIILLLVEEGFLKRADDARLP
jgi:hypothetical protein